MKTKFLSLTLLTLALSLMSMTSYAQTSSITLGYTASISPSITNYVVSYGTQHLVYTNSVSVGTNLTATITGLTTNVPYFFAVQSINTNGGISVYSTEATAIILTTPIAPTGTHIIVITP